jgi:hypothetical protein
MTPPHANRLTHDSVCARASNILLSLRQAQPSPCVARPSPPASPSSHDSGRTHPSSRPASPRQVHPSPRAPRLSPFANSSLHRNGGAHPSTRQLILPQVQPLPCAALTINVTAEVTPRSPLHWSGRPFVPPAAPRWHGALFTVVPSSTAPAHAEPSRPEAARDDDHAAVLTPALPATTPSPAQAAAIHLRVGSGPRRCRDNLAPARVSRHDRFQNQVDLLGEFLHFNQRFPLRSSRNSVEFSLSQFVCRHRHQRASLPDFKINSLLQTHPNFFAPVLSYHIDTKPSAEWELLFDSWSRSYSTDSDYSDPVDGTAYILSTGS